MVQIFRDLVDKVRINSAKFSARILVIRLKSINQDGTESVLDPAGPAVSLTSYGKRVDTVYLAIESIARGSLKPSELVLWVDDRNIYENLPPTLRKLQARGLSIRMSENFGPHTKYYPYVRSKSAFDKPLVTADDDMLYPKKWLSRLRKAHERDQHKIHCYRAHVVKLNETGIAPYMQWERCKSGVASFQNFGTGVSGVIYPVEMLDFLKSSGVAFLDCCPKADDVWLHVSALRSGHQIRQIVRRPKHFQAIPGTEDVGLMHENIAQGNDVQIAATYSALDIKKLRDEAVTAEGTSE